MSYPISYCGINMIKINYMFIMQNGCSCSYCCLWMYPIHSWRPRKTLSLEVARCGARPEENLQQLHSMEVVFAKENKETSLNSHTACLVECVQSWCPTNMSRPKSSLTVFLALWAVQRLGSMTCCSGDPAPPYYTVPYSTTRFFCATFKWQAVWMDNVLHLHSCRILESNLIILNHVQSSWK